MWRKIAVREPVSTMLVLNGVCVSLRDYGNVPTDLPASSHAGVYSSNTDTAQSAGLHQTATDQVQEGNGWQQHCQPKNGVDAASIEQTGPPAMSRPSPVRTQQAAATMTHTLLRQWGAEVYVTIHPAGWTKDKESPESKPGPQPVNIPGQPFQLQTPGFARLNSIWESQEGSGDESTPATSGVKSLFDGHPSVRRSPETEPESPEQRFTNRQSNPLCKAQLECSSLTWNLTTYSYVTYHVVTASVSCTPARICHCLKLVSSVVLTVHMQLQFSC